MQMHGNTIFITGGTSGIGCGLAEACHQRGNQVIIASRREDRLKEICKRSVGMEHFVVEVTKPESIRTVAGSVIERFPKLNCVINNAGIQMHVEFGSGKHLDDEKLQAEINTNLLGPLRVAAAFLPHLANRSNEKPASVWSMFPRDWLLFPWRVIPFIAPPKPRFIRGHCLSATNSELRTCRCSN